MEKNLHKSQKHSGEQTSDKGKNLLIVKYQNIAYRLFLTGNRGFWKYITLRAYTLNLRSDLISDEDMQNCKIRNMYYKHTNQLFTLLHVLFQVRNKKKKTLSLHKHCCPSHNSLIFPDFWFCVFFFFSISMYFLLRVLYFLMQEGVERPLVHKAVRTRGFVTEKPIPHVCWRSQRRPCASVW